MTIPERRDHVWLTMANQFLDSEERPEIPKVALTLLEAGLTVDEARRVWMYEVSPALALNLWSVAGEWGAWDPEFVRARVRAVRGDPSRHHGLRWLGYWVAMFPFHGIWRTIEDCMGVLEQTPTCERAGRAHDLGVLAAHFFDFLPRPIPEEERERLRSTYELWFHRAMGRAIFSGEAHAGQARVRAAVAP